MWSYACSAPFTKHPVKAAVWTMTLVCMATMEHVFSIASHSAPIHAAMHINESADVAHLPISVAACRKETACLSPGHQTEQSLAQTTGQTCQTGRQLAQSL